MINKEQFLKKFSILKIIPKEYDLNYLYDLLSSEKKVILKLGADPTSSFLHLGHIFILYYIKELMKDFENIEFFFILGGFTSFVGDPSLRNKGRKFTSLNKLSDNRINIEKYVSIFFNKYNIKIVNNFNWLSKYNLLDFFILLKKISLNKLIARKDIKKRLENKINISSAEILYPVLQGLDSVELNNHIEIGGNDQLFNIFFSRQIQIINKNSNIQIGLLFPILPSMSSQIKISKTNIINDISTLDSLENIFLKIILLKEDKLKLYMKLFNFEDQDKYKFGYFIVNLFILFFNNMNKYTLKYFNKISLLLKQYKFTKIFFYNIKNNVKIKDFFINTLKLSNNYCKQLIKNNNVFINKQKITYLDFKKNNFLFVKTEKNLFDNNECFYLNFCKQLFIITVV